MQHLHLYGTPEIPKNDPQGVLTLEPVPVPDPDEFEVHPDGQSGNVVL